MRPTDTLVRVDAVEREKLEQARTMPPAEKLIAGARLFDYACRVTLAGIRSQHPDADDAQALDILRRRLDWARQTEQQT